jgi:hypothetical protein
MSPVAIILGIVIIILIYILYKYFTTSTSTLGAIVDLSKTSSATAFTKKGDVTNSTSTRYSYSVWVYVDTWDSNEKKDIFYRNRVGVSGSTPEHSDIRLYLDQGSPTLKCEFYTNISQTQPTETITVTNNFAVQKWVCVVISVDNKIIDCYIDGKLVTSQQLQNQPIVTDSDIFVGTFKAHLAKFQRTTSPIDPQTAWSNYMSGNGGNSLKKMFSSYGVDVSFKKDNVEQQKFSII